MGNALGSPEKVWGEKGWGKAQAVFSFSPVDFRPETFEPVERSTCKTPLILSEVSSISGLPVKGYFFPFFIWENTSGAYHY